MPREVKCPRCRKQGPWLELPSGPFCSSRCKLLDLGQWLDEEHRISSPLAPEHLEDLPVGFQDEGRSTPNR